MAMTSIITLNQAAAEQITAGSLSDNMTADERFAYIAGVTEGLAYSRFLKDRPDETGMSCIYDWFYGGKIRTRRRIDAWFARHPDKPVGTLLYVLIKKECGA